MHFDFSESTEESNEEKIVQGNVRRVLEEDAGQVAIDDRLKQEIKKKNGKDSEDEFVTARIKLERGENT